MYEKTITDIMIERGILKPLPSSFILDADEPYPFILDGEVKPQKQEKDRE